MSNILLKTNIGNDKGLAIRDAAQAIQFRTSSTPNYRYMMHRLSGMSYDSYNDMEYDLTETARILDTEAFVSETFKKKRQLILKNGFVIESENKQNLDYINKRIEEMEFVAQMAFEDLVEEITESMVNYNNCFLVKYRSDVNSSGNIRYLPSGKQFKPISAIYTLAAPTVDTATNSKTGVIRRYRHRVTAQYSKEFRPDDIYHIYTNKRIGMTIGTPSLEAVRDDILSLRSIEQYVEDMIRKNAAPFTHVQVGTDALPARMLEGEDISEVDVYANIIDNLDYTSGVATPHRVKISYLGSESVAMRLEGYLNHFKNRVLAGLSVSEADLGGKQGGKDVLESLKGDVRSYQDTIGRFITNYIFTELLLESDKYGTKFFIPKKDRVVFKFIDPDEERKIKQESHALNLFVSGLITKEAAIRGTRYTVKDLQPDEVVTPGTGSTTKLNSVRSNIRNNIISPVNQHTEKLNTPVEDSTIVFYSEHFDNFLTNIEEEYPLSFFSIDTLGELHDEAILMVLEYGEKYTDEWIRDALFALL